MGAESSILDNCHLEKTYTSLHLPGYSVQPGETGDGQHINVFLQKTNKHVDAIKKYVKNLKTIRHPYVLRYISSGITAGVPFLATEKSVPLTTALPQLHQAELVSGLSNIIQSLAFIHNKLLACHNNVGLLSVYVGRDGSWKLGNFEHMSKFTHTTLASLEKCHAMQKDMYIPPEETESDQMTKPELLYSRDVYALGALVVQLLSNITDDQHISEIVAYARAELQHPDPAQRPRMSSVLSADLFRNDFLDIWEYLSSLVTKDSEEKRAFFMGLLSRITVLPDELVARRLARPLLSRFALHDPTALLTVIPRLLTPVIEGKEDTNGLLPEKLFREYLVPELLKIFTVRSLHVRLCLLTHLPQFLHSLTREEIVEHVFPQLLLGLRDTSDDLVVASLQSLSLLVPLIGADVIIGGPRFSFFETGQPKFMRKGNNNLSPEELNISNGTSSVEGSMIADRGTRERDMIADRGTRGTGIEMRQENRHESQTVREPTRTESSKTRVNVAFDDGETISQNSRKYGSVGHENGMFASWDVEGDDVQCDRSENDGESVESVESDDVQRTVRVYDDDKLQDREADAGRASGALKLTVNRGHKQRVSQTSTFSNDSNVNNDPSVELESNDSDWLADETWPPLHSPIETGMQSSTQIPNKIPNGSAVSTLYGELNRAKTSQGLGEEFDVKSIQVTALASATHDVDFFADMEPDLKLTTKTRPHSDSQHCVLNSKNVGGLTDVMGITSKSTFDVIVSEDSCGWGEEDLDWGNDF